MAGAFPRTFLFHLEPHEPCNGSFLARQCPSSLPFWASRLLRDIPPLPQPRTVFRPPVVLLFHILCFQVVYRHASAPHACHAASASTTKGMPPAFAESVDPDNLTQVAGRVNKGRHGPQNTPTLACNVACCPGLPCMVEARLRPVSTSPDRLLSCPSLRAVLSPAKGPAALHMACEPCLVLF